MFEKLKELFKLIAEEGLQYVEYRGQNTYFCVPRDEKMQSMIFALSQKVGLNWLYYAKMLSDLADAGFLYVEIDATKQYEIFLREGEL